MTSQYNGDELQNHIISVVEGQSTTVYCELQCSNNILSGCDIIPDWLLMIPHTYRMYSLNSNDRQTLRDELGMGVTFSSPPDVEQCSINGVQSVTFSVTLLNFYTSLEEVVVICGLKRRVSGSSSHAIKQFALLKQNVETIVSTGTKFILYY